MMKLIDLTRLLRDKMPVFPGDSAMKLDNTRTLAADGYCNHELTINMHTGTHIDGPMHLTDSGRRICDFPLEQLMGQASVLDVSGLGVIDYKAEYESLVGEETILLLHTGHGAYFGQESYFTAYPVLTKAFAELAVRKRVKMVGLDTPSPDKVPYEVHRLLMDNGILIAENLVNVDQLLGLEEIEIIALPLLIEADSSIARVIARVKGAGVEVDGRRSPSKHGPHSD